MAQTFFFYDLETSGLNPRQDRIMQFAGQRTDMNLEPIGEPYNLLVTLNDDTLPNPDALMVTGITPQKTVEEGYTEAQFARMLSEEIFTPDTIAVGFNNIRFDDEFIRHLLWRNFHDPYEWSWKEGRSRWDMLDVVRLTRGSAFDYAYDKAGNRIRQTMGGEARVHTIDTDSNRLLGITGRPEKAYAYDATGNRTGDGQNQWQYDARGRLVGLQGAAGAARYRVDALGRRVSKQVSGDNGLPVEIGYHYDQAGRLIAESDAQGNIRREYLWLEETPLAIVQ